MVTDDVVTHLPYHHTTPTVSPSDNGKELKSQSPHKTFTVNITLLKSILLQFIIFALNRIVERTNRKILEILRHVSAQRQLTMNNTSMDHFNYPQARHLIKWLTAQKRVIYSAYKWFMSQSFQIDKIIKMQDKSTPVSFQTDVVYKNYAEG